MFERKGALISFEGGDGSGKGTQSKLFKGWLDTLGVPNHFDSFPRYHTPTGEKVARYLNGNPDKLDARQASSLYSDDRLAARDELTGMLNDGRVVILDRYVDSNKGHQGGKLGTFEERAEFFEEVDELEFGQNNLPVPDKTILFPMPAELAQSYVDQKMARRYTSSKRDFHEADPEHLRHANESYMQLAKSQPNRFIIIDPIKPSGEEMRPKEEIQLDVRAALRPLLEMRGLIRPEL